jgi:hypothetical protein
MRMLGVMYILPWCYSAGKTESIGSLDQPERLGAMALLICTTPYISYTLTKRYWPVHQIPTGECASLQHYQEKQKQRATPRRRSSDVHSLGAHWASRLVQSRPRQFTIPPRCICILAELDVIYNFQAWVIFLAHV